MSEGISHRVLLIRHGETVDNVAGLYAGSRDSALTNHGVLQTEKLGTYLANSGVVFTHLFSSDLSRASKTARAVRAAQPSLAADALPLVECAELREQDFGTYEGKPFTTRTSTTKTPTKNVHLTEYEDQAVFEAMETKESMSLRADSFLDTHLVPLLTNTSPEAPLVVAVVSHGMLLSSLWRAILKRQQRSSVTLAADVLRDHGNVSIEHLGGWSNTAYLELLFHPRSPVVDPSEALGPKSNDDCATVTSAGQPTAPNYLDTVSKAAVTAPGELRTGKATATGNEPNTRTGACSTSLTDGLLDIEGVAMSAKPPSFQITILAVNSTVHLKGLKRTRGGVGSAQHDEKQKSLHSFFSKKQKTG